MPSQWVIYNVFPLIFKGKSYRNPFFSIKPRLQPHLYFFEFPTGFQTRTYNPETRAAAQICVCRVRRTFPLHSDWSSLNKLGGLFLSHGPNQWAISRDPIPYNCLGIQGFFLSVVQPVAGLLMWLSMDHIPQYVRSPLQKCRDGGHSLLIKNLTQNFIHREGL